MAQLHAFGFAARWVGRGFAYLFIGIYFTTVVPKGGIDQALDTLTDVDLLLPLIAGLIMLVAGVLFILLHLCPCGEGRGCCQDGQFLDAVRNRPRP